jgi:protein-disulfide isomerase-like protein with CxxC motif
MTPELRQMAERLLVLHDDHMHAIQTRENAFYHDGRHQELVDLLHPVHQALGIKPWDDSSEMLKEALANDASA